MRDNTFLLILWTLACLVIGLNIGINLPNRDQNDKLNLESKAVVSLDDLNVSIDLLGSNIEALSYRIDDLSNIEINIMPATRDWYSVGPDTTFDYCRGLDCFTDVAIRDAMDRAGLSVKQGRKGLVGQDLNIPPSKEDLIRIKELHNQGWYESKNASDIVLIKIDPTLDTFYFKTLMDYYLVQKVK